MTQLDEAFRETISLADVLETLSTEDISANSKAIRKMVRQSQRRCATIFGGVLEHREGGNIDMAVDTDMGHLVVEGKVVERHSKRPPWEAWIEGLDAAIEEVFGSQDTTDAFSEMANLWSRLDSLVEHAAARSSVLSRQISSPNQSNNVPAWFTTQINTIIDEEPDEAPTNWQIRAAREIVRAIAVQTDWEPTVDIGPGGTILLDWLDTRGHFQWIIGFTHFSWPVVQIHQLARYDEGHPQTRIHHSVLGALDDLAKAEALINDNSSGLL